MPWPERCKIILPILPWLLKEAFDGNELGNIPLCFFTG